MARPRRPDIEREAVEAAAAIVRGSSVQNRAANIARRVVDSLLAFDEIDRSEPVLAVLAELAAQLPESPFDVLATSPDVDLVSLLHAKRVDRFRDRGCSQLPPEGWRRETAAIRRELERVLARRFARHLRENSFQKPVFRKSRGGTPSHEMEGLQDA